MSARGLQRYLLALGSVGLLCSPCWGGGVFNLFTFCRHPRPATVFNQEHGYFATQWAAWPEGPEQAIHRPGSGVPAPQTPGTTPVGEPEPELIPPPRIQGATAPKAPANSSGPELPK
jgi:hypothetical protein